VCQCSRFPGNPCTQPHRCFCGHTWRTLEPDDHTYQLDHAGAEVLDGTDIAALQNPRNDTAERLRLALEVIDELTTINTQLRAENAALKTGNTP
jgi:hypothetical protein